MKPTRIIALMLGIFLALGMAVLAQQHSYTAAEIEAGSKLYDSNCGRCHGENGDGVPGIDFTKGTFKNARSDEDIVRVIRSGIPAAGMPASAAYSEAQASTVVAYIRSLLGGRAAANVAATALTGDAARGKVVFEGKGNCLSCHAINGAGATSGPDLGGARGGGGRGGLPPVPAAGAPPAGAGAAAPGRGGRGGAPGAGGRGGAAPPAAAGAPAGPPAAAQAGRGGGGGRGGATPPNPQQIERSLIDPSAEIAAQYRVYQVVTKANVTARGSLLNQDTFSVQLRDPNDKLMSYWKQDLKEFGFMPSPMPSYKDKLTPQEIADVVSYLVSLRTN